MEVINTINAKILSITLKINKEHPELSKYLSEMPVTIPTDENPEMNLKILTNYYDSLVKLLKEYCIEHP